MLEANYLRETAVHLRARAETALQAPMRAQLLELADYYDGMAEDAEQPVPVAIGRPFAAHR